MLTRNLETSLIWQSIKPINNNTVIKGDGGAIGLTEDFGGWTSVSEVSHLVAEHEAKSGVKDAALSSKQHEQATRAQISILQNVNAFVTVLKEIGNPFLEDSTGLLVLDTKNKADLA